MRRGGQSDGGGSGHVFCPGLQIRSFQFGQVGASELGNTAVTHAEVRTRLPWIVHHASMPLTRRPRA